MWGETFEHTTFGISFLKNTFNNTCFSGLLWLAKAIHLTLRQEGGDRKSHHTKHFHYQTLGKVRGNQKGTISILIFCSTNN